ncbi:MAG: LysR family transcriptional regulator [Woeseiaceae bacterium]|nr:LysR family transcriptional regulator [Woeseiaceae bacterium]
MRGELKQISNLALFAKVVQCGGISRCAANLGLERTTVSRRLADLENDLGVELLTRTPKAVTVTRAGRRCYDQCEGILELARSAELAATNGRPVVNLAPVTVRAPTDVVEHFVAPALASSEIRKTGVDVTCGPTSGRITVLDPQTDFLLSWEKLSAKEYYVSTVGAFQQAVYASPDYLTRHGEPDAPGDLHAHTRIGLSTPPRPSAWSFEANGKKRQVTARPEVEVSNMLEAASSALAGIGLTLLPSYLCERDVRAGRLRAVLRNFHVPPKQMYLVARKAAGSKPHSTALRLFLERWLREAAVTPENSLVTGPAPG